MINQPIPTRTKTYVLNPDVLDSLGNQISHPARIWVDDVLITALGIMAMKMTLTTVIEAIFVVPGEPDLKYRQCSVAIDKWIKLGVVEH